MMMFYSKTPPKVHFKEEEIQPWNSDEPNMLNLIIESSQTNKDRLKIRKFSSEPKRIPSHLLKEAHSYNFYTNLRKYQKRKVEDFLAKKEVNYIAKNIKGVSQEYSSYQESSPQYLIDKMIQDKNENSKKLHSQFSSTIEPINWSLVTQFEQNKVQKKQKYKGLQSFIKFQQKNHGKDSFNQLVDEETFEDAEQINKKVPDKYQAVLKMRQGLRKRNLKSSDETRQKFDNALSIQQYCKSTKLANTAKVGSVVTPKTSHQMRKKSISQTMKGSKHFKQYLSASNPVKNDFSKPYTSHLNRVKLPIRFSIQ